MGYMNDNYADPYYKKKVMVVYGGRSDKGLLDILVEELKKQPNIKTSSVCAMPMSKEYLDDSDYSIARITGNSLMLMTQVLNDTKPDLIVVLGDRYEILAACTAAHLMRIPIAHLHGGEVTNGSLDDKMRNAITAMADIHFPSTWQHGKRVRNLSTGRVYNVGALGAVRKDGEWSNPADVEHPYVLVSVPAGEPEICEAIAEALDIFAPAQYLWVGPNADAGRSKLLPYCTTAEGGLPHGEYMSLLRAADVIVGNSSSGIIEAHSVGTPSVQVGDRQKGRTRPDSVIDVSVDVDAIVDAMYRAMDMEMSSENPYHKEGTAQRIVKYLCEFLNVEHSASAGD